MDKTFVLCSDLVIMKGITDSREIDYDCSQS